MLSWLRVLTLTCNAPMVTVIDPPSIWFDNPGRSGHKWLSSKRCSETDRVSHSKRAHSFVFNAFSGESLVLWIPFSITSKQSASVLMKTCRCILIHIHMLFLAKIVSAWQAIILCASSCPMKMLGQDSKIFFEKLRLVWALKATWPRISVSWSNLQNQK